MRGSRRRTASRRDRTASTQHATTDCARASARARECTVELGIGDPACARDRDVRAAIARDETTEPRTKQRRIDIPRTAITRLVRASVSFVSSSQPRRFPTTFNHGIARTTRANAASSISPSPVAGARSGSRYLQRLRQRIRKGLREIDQQFGDRRRAHADRIRQAGAHRDAVVRHARRQIEHVARFEHPFVRRREFAQQLEFGVVRGNRIGASTDRC